MLIHIIFIAHFKLGEISLSKEHCDTCAESTATGESAANGTTSNKDIVDSPTSPLLQEEVRLLPLYLYTYMYMYIDLSL